MSRYKNHKKLFEEKYAQQQKRKQSKITPAQDAYYRDLADAGMKQNKKISDQKKLEDAFARDLNLYGIPHRREVRLFAEHVGAGKGLRKRLDDQGLADYRFDFVFDELRLCVEVQGGIWREKGAHNTGTAITRDCRKSFAAKRIGWNVLPITDKMIKSGEVANWLADYINQRV